MDKEDIDIRKLFSTTEELVNLREMYMLLHEKLNALHLDYSRENFFGEEDLGSLHSFIEEYPFLYQMQQQVEKDSLNDSLADTVIIYKKERRKIPRLQVAFSIELFVLLSALVFYFSQSNQQSYSNDVSKVEIEESQLKR